MTNLRETALTLYRSGLNVLPALRKQKRPVGAWKQYAQTRPAFDVAFPAGLSFDALAVVCGATSGGLEIIDFDQRAKLFPAWQGLVGDKLCGLTVESTQSGGKHVAFRSNSCGRNQKLATNPEGCAIETRGEGGICIIAPSEGYCVESGSWLDVRFLSDSDRAFLLDAAKSLTRAPNGESVADYLRQIEAGKDALTRAGWSMIREDSEWEYWRRPGQTVEDKHGATYSKRDRFFHVFTSNGAPFEQDKTYSHLQIVALLDFGGDLSAASKHWRPNRTVNVVETFNPFDVEKEVEKDAGKFPARLFNVGGLIQEIQDVINENAIRPQPEGAFLGALAFMSFLAGRTLALNYRGTLVTPNLYALFLAPSGMGKEIIRRVGTEIARAYNPKESVPESFASVQALQNLTSRVRKILWLHDEFGRDLAVMNNQTNSNITGVITESLKLYSNANNRAYLPKLIAQEAKGAKSVEPVDRPSLTIFATGNPREFFDATNETILSNGYISRFTIVQGRTYSEKRATTFEEATSAPVFTLPASLRSRVKKWADFELASADPTLCKFDRAAFDCINAFDQKSEKEIMRETLAGGWIAEFKARLFEKAWKYALLFAASKYGVVPSMVVDRDCAENATALVSYESELFTANQDRFASSGQTRLMQSVIDWSKELPGRRFTKSQFTRKFQREPLRERDEALRSLIEGEYLAPCEIDAKKGFCLL